MKFDKFQANGKIIKEVSQELAYLIVAIEDYEIPHKELKRIISELSEQDYKQYCEIYDIGENNE